MERRSIRVRGIVQGVGFRPFVHGLATRLGLAGCVRNQTSGVVIEAEGAAGDLDALLDELERHPPPLAQIDEITWSPAEPRGDTGFRIERSQPDAAADVFVSPDAATCDDCLRELFDPGDRRHGYAFLNCTNCGPRLTIVQGVPYDRANTTMAGFAMCEACRAEYENPRDRRFHAEPIACPACGPRLAWFASAGATGQGDPLARAIQLIASGGIVAIKGLGGYHLACDATNGATVDELRRRKGREARPFAMMVRDAAMARDGCELPGGAERLLESRERPIVLLRARPASAIAAGVAPGMRDLGLMLPYTPLHSLLMRGLHVPIVLTSGNASDLPMCYRDDEARERLAPMCDGMLVHDRPIAWRCDDSVVRWTGRRAIPIRRSRGFAPRPLPLTLAAERPLLALGGHQKNVFCLVRGARAFMSHHIGDLDEYEAVRSLRETVAHYERLLAIAPAAIACDLHPDYASTRFARELASARGLPVVAVQHHHAHAASVMVEHGLSGPALGVSLDGTGLGTDGTVWGFEFLRVEGANMRRLGSLEAVPMPGGEAAVREPWRMALAHLHRAHDGNLPPLDLAPLAELDDAHRQVFVRMLEGGVHAPLTSSAGRLFDAVAAILGIRQYAQFEGQAAMELEAAASGGDAEPLPVELGAGTDGFVVRMGDAIRALAEARARGGEVARLAARFHATIVRAIVLGAERARESHGLERVLLSGGSFQNAFLLEGSFAALEAAGFAVYTNERVPPNDGGLALGQAAVAIATQREAVAGR